MPQPIRVLIPIDTDSPESLGHALEAAKQIAARTKSNQILLLTHAKAQLRHSSLATHLGMAAAKALDAGQAVSLSSDVTLIHGTKQTVRYSVRNAVIVVFYADDRLLEFVDGLSDVAGVVVVPDIVGEVAGWVERWTPLAPGQEAPASSAPIIDDPVIEQALLSVTKIINLSHSGLYARDKQWADEALRILRAKGHAAEPDKIKSWAIRNGWTPGAATDLATLAKRIFALKAKPNLSAIYDPAGKYERWSS